MTPEVKQKLTNVADEMVAIIGAGKAAGLSLNEITDIFLNVMVKFKEAEGE